MFLDGAKTGLAQIIWYSRPSRGGGNKTQNYIQSCNQNFSDVRLYLLCSLWLWV